LNGANAKERGQSGKVSKTDNCSVASLRMRPHAFPLISVWLMFDQPHFANAVHNVNMKSDHPSDFTCPHCQARYKIVRMQSEPGVAHRMLQCTVCGQSLAPTENDYILKYFLVSQPRRDIRA